MTTQININSKSQLAKLIATENIQVEHNAVSTASFDVLNRILTLPIFKVQSGNVYDMLIAHECAHALYTPNDGWKTIMNDNELRGYCNVLEDCRIDKKIQKKYPGVVKNYLAGFDILNSQDFFGIKDKDINTELMLIDKINLFYKSSKRLSINFSTNDNVWLKKVDSLKTWNDVVTLAKEMLEWQKKQVKKIKKLPEFDKLIQNYKLSDDDNDSSNNKNEDVNIENLDTSNTQNNKKQDDEKDDVNKSSAVSNTYGPGGGKGSLSVLTDVSFELNKQKLLNTSTKYTYLSIPDVQLDKVIVSYKDFINDFKKHIKEQYTRNIYGDRIPKESSRTGIYHNWLKQDFKKFLNNNKKTVMYLVKEFEMKKAATSYKRAVSDKTGILDPLKLKNYKFSDDIFKRLTIVPNAKNHGMMMLLDWSGSMSTVLKNTVDQLINLVYFCQKVQIPFEVYLFSSEAQYRIKSVKESLNEVNESNTPSSDIYTFKKIKSQFKVKNGDMAFDNFALVNIASHRMKKTELDESMLYLYSMGLYYGNRFYTDRENSSANQYNFGMPDHYCLGSTPLNEGITTCLKLIPMFKNKYQIEKLTFMTLTDGAANSGRGKVVNTPEGLKLNYRDTNDIIIKFNKKNFSIKKCGYWSSQTITGILLDIIRKEYNVNTLGFYILKNTRGWEAERLIGNNYNLSKEDIKKREQLRKNKVAVINDQEGYDEFYLMLQKHLNVENADISSIDITSTKTSLRKEFSKAMKGRITSRVLLNKFIEKVA